jgi:NADPH2:quinone reductase
MSPSANVPGINRHGEIGGNAMKAWRLHEYGAPRDVLRLEDVPAPEPGAREIRVRVAAITLNYNDLDGITGRYLTIRPPLPYVPGMEVLGRVEAAGPGAEPWVGKRVCAIPNGGFGGYAQQAICPAACAFEMPDDLPDPEAAAIFYPFHLSWYSLFERGRLARGETAVIHAAAGGIGSAAVQLAHHAGARVIATAGSDAKLALCRELGADLAINYRKDSFADLVNDATDGRGADVVFDSVGGETTVQSFRCMAFGGRLLSLGFASGIEAEDQATFTPRPLLFGNFSLVGVCWAYMDDPLAFRRQTGFNFPSHQDGESIHREVLALVRRGAIRPLVGQRADFADLPAAFDAVIRRETIGRTVILVNG